MIDAHGLERFIGPMEAEYATKATRQAVEDPNYWLADSALSAARCIMHGLDNVAARYAKEATALAQELEWRNALANSGHHH